MSDIQAHIGADTRAEEAANNDARLGLERNCAAEPADARSVQPMLPDATENRQTVPLASHELAQRNLAQSKNMFVRKTRRKPGTWLRGCSQKL